MFCLALISFVAPAFAIYSVRKLLGNGYVLLQINSMDRELPGFSRFRWPMGGLAVNTPSIPSGVNHEQRRASAISAVV